MALSAGDKVEIAELAARYYYAADRLDGAAVAAMFAEDGVLEAFAQPLIGRAALERAFSQSPPAGALQRHLIGYPVIEGTGDTATMRVYVELKRLVDGRMATVLVGWSHDELRRIDSSWLFTRRHLDVEFYSGA